MAVGLVFVVSSLFGAVARRVSYVIKYQRYLDELNQKIEELERSRERLADSVDCAKRNGEGIEGSLERWLISSGEIADEALKFVKAKEKAKKRCFKGLCPNLRTRYQLSKKAERKIKAVALLQKEIKSYKASCSTSGEKTWLISNQGDDAFESRMFTYKDILNGLQNPILNMIGVYGIAGVGKTTLVKEVGKQAKKEKLFDEVVFVWASSTPNIKKIQGQIADQLSLELGEGTESERARTVCHRLRKEEKVLVILDDVWTSLDLETIGIPFADAHRGCKILLTSRSRDILVGRMNSQYNYCLSVLNQEEAWSLFAKTIGDCIEENDLQSIANQVAKECGGLPLAIVTVARALRNKSLVEWKDALQKLRSSAGKFNALNALVRSSIELSYNYLENEELKLTFLLCSLMKHAYDAPIMDLLKYGMALGLFEDTYTMQERRDKVYALVNKLKGSCLLLDGHTKDSFAMHDIVRDVAMSIAYRDQHIFTVRSDVPIGWPDKEIQENCTAVSLHDINIKELRQGFECPELKFFSMNPKDPFFKIPDNFFAGMTKLTALALNKMQLLSLPSSFHLLQNLETLCLDECVLGDISSIGNLKKLEILSFFRSDIEQLPKEIGQLTRLELLDLSHCSKLKVIPQNVISSLSRLEELYMGNTSIEWELEGLNIGRSNASLLELKHLSKLTTLEIHIRDALILPRGLFSKKLERYKIFIGDEWDWSTKYENKRMLKLQLHTSICLDDVIMQLKGIEELYLDEVPGIKNVLYDLDKEGFPQLKRLHVQNNPYISCITDSASLVHHDAFPLLESLVLHNLSHLEKIYHGQLCHTSLCNLKIIKVRNCGSLKSIFSLSDARGLVGLHTIEVIKCKNLEEIFTVGREDKVNCDGLDEIEFGELRFLTLKFLPRLTSFYSLVKTPAKPQKRYENLTTHTPTSEVILEDELSTPMPFFNGKVVFPNLETLELCAISSEKLWHNQPAAVASCFQNLTRLIVHSCDKLKYLFTSTIVSNFVQLQHLEICYCMALEEIVAKERGKEVTAKFLFPTVTYLKLWNLSELRTVYPRMHAMEWPSLRKLEVYGCDKVKTFTSEFLSFQESNKEGQLDIPAPRALFLVNEVPNLKELKLNGKDFRTICGGQFGKQLFRDLKFLHVMNDKSENFAIGLLNGYPNLEKVELRGCSYNELFSYEEIEKHAGTLAQIKSLKLWELSELMHIWKQDSKLNSVVQNLETLEVWWCDNLRSLVPSLASFNNLTTLEVWYCKGLKNLVTPSTAKSLVHLVKLRVDGCKLMTEVISNEGDVAEDEIVFSKLKWLSLECLESLTCFCSGNHTFKFPSLEDLFVIECPKMRIFSYGDLSTPKLQEVRQNWGLDKGCWDGDLNTTMEKLHMNKLPSPLPSVDFPSFSPAEAATADKLAPNLIGGHKTHSPSLPAQIDPSSFSLAEATSSSMQSPSLFGSQKTPESIPPGVVFNPSDEQLVFHYLMRKVFGHTDGEDFYFIKDIELYEHEPSQLPNLARDSGHDKMYFFTHRNMKGGSVNRQATGGFWKTMGKLAYIKDRDGNTVATKTSLAYYRRNDQTSEPVRTRWLMKEYMLVESQPANKNEEESERLTEWTLCVVYSHQLLKDKN